MSGGSSRGAGDQSVLSVGMSNGYVRTEYSVYGTVFQLSSTAWFHTGTIANIMRPIAPATIASRRPAAPRRRGQTMKGIGIASAIAVAGRVSAANTASRLTA